MVPVGRLNVALSDKKSAKKKPIFRVRVETATHKKAGTLHRDPAFVILTSFLTTL